VPRFISNGQLNCSVLSHSIRRRYDARGQAVILFEDDLRICVGDSELPNPDRQADNLILWIGNNQESPEEWANVTPQWLAAVVGTRITTQRSDEPGLSWLLNQVGNDLFSLSSTVNGTEMRFQLKMQGWRTFNGLRRKVVTSHVASMAMKFSEPTIAKVLNECFKPAALRAGYTLRAINEAQPAGLIDNQIRAAIRSAGFIVADLSDDNNGAYFEAGFAEGIGVPVIYTCEFQKFSAKKTHFDTNHMHTIPWDIGDLGAAGRLLTATIRATLPDEALFE
jgi:hypothetical protein